MLYSFEKATTIPRISNKIATAIFHIFKKRQYDYFNYYYSIMHSSIRIAVTDEIMLHLSAAAYSLNTAVFFEKLFICCDKSKKLSPVWSQHESFRCVHTSR